MWGKEARPLLRKANWKDPKSPKEADRSLFTGRNEGRGRSKGEKGSLQKKRGAKEYIAGGVAKLKNTHTKKKEDTGEGGGILLALMSLQNQDRGKKKGIKGQGSLRGAGCKK